MNFFERAKVLFPWLPDALIQVYADAWAETDSQDIAYATVVANPQFDDFFPGLKRPDGSLRMSPVEYASTFEGYNRVLVEANLNPGFFADQMIQWFEGDVSVGEAQQRVSLVRNEVLNNIEPVREFYATVHGLELTDEALVANALNPDLGEDIFNRRIDVAQVGGEAAQAGFTIGRGQAQRLVSAGVNQAQARGLFGTAANVLPGLDRSAGRFGVDQTFELDEFLGAQVFNDPIQNRRINRLLGQERAQFTRTGVRRSNQGLAGLRER